MDNVEYIPAAMKITKSRKGTQIMISENLRLNTTHPIKEDREKTIKKSIPSNYAEFNYYGRVKERRKAVRELCDNNINDTNAVALTLTFDQNGQNDQNYTDMETAHYEFKKFIQRVNDHYSNFMYVATFSRQRNGNWHYHVICNFSQSITKKEVAKLWGKGITYVTHIKSKDMYKRTVDYLIKNMDSSQADTRGKKGYLAPKSAERNKVVTSYRSEHQEEFEKSFAKVNEAERKIIRTSEYHLGIQGNYTNPDTGKMSHITIPDEQLTPALESIGYKDWNTTHTYIKSSADFSAEFAPLTSARKKRKKSHKTK